MVIDLILNQILEELKGISKKLDKIAGSSVDLQKKPTSNIEEIKERIAKERESVKRRNSKENEFLPRSSRKE